MLKISACTIVRDEEKHIKHWIENVRVFADEIIVVDTGSVDKTREIVQQMGAELYEFAWCDDFSAAKNYALDKASGDWVVMLDADEFFDAESQHRLRRMVEKYQRDKKVAGFITPFINIDVNHGNRMLSRNYQVRVFRREPQLRFRGKVHEALANLAPKGNDRDYLLVEELQFIHTGYSVDNIVEKQKRNLAIIQAEIAEQGGEHPRQYGYLLDCYMVTKDYKKAIHYARLALEHWTETGLLGQEKKIVCQLLEAIRLSGGEGYEHELENALQKFPKVRELWFFKGRYLYNNLYWLEAEDAFRQAEVLGERPITDSSDIYNSALGDINPVMHEYMRQIDRYRGFFTAFAAEDYLVAANKLWEYWQALGARGQQKETGKVK